MDDSAIIVKNYKHREAETGGIVQTLQHSLCQRFFLCSS